MLVPIPVEDVATRPVETVDVEATVGEVADRLAESPAGSLVVTDAGDPVGIVTESDFVDAFAAGTDPGTAVRSVMSAPLVTVQAGEQVETAASAAREHGVKKLPVLEGGELVGVVTTTDLSYYLPELARLRASGAEADPEDEAPLRRIHRDVRLDTAYEREDWHFEYEAPEDNAEGNVEVGDVARFSKTLSDDDVRTFADATGDTNRLHLDDEFAESTRFGRRIVHGTLSTGVISAALARLPGLTIYLSKDLHFLGPVDVGERVTAVCEVTEDLGGNKFQLSTTVRREDGEAVVSGSTTVLVDDLPDGAGEFAAVEPPELE
jgi:acyl dehydratase/predicted transcriptional regulator